MRKFEKILRFIAPAACLLLAVACCAETTSPTDNEPDLSKEPTLYVVGYAHLDTEWRWEYPQVINE
jgi:alpha-mannosidase